MNKAEEIYKFVNEKILLLQTESSWSSGMLARLRRGVGKDPSEVPDAWEITLNELPSELLCRGYSEKDSVTEAELAVHTALTLYAVHQQGINYVVSANKSKGGLSFGKAIRRLISPDKINDDPIKRRFDAMVTANDIYELSYHARGLVQLMRSSVVPIKMDYPQFAKDLYDYQRNGKDRVRLCWGQDFYSHEKKENGKEE